LITAVLPAANAGTNGPNVSINGSFHAPMISVTPQRLAPNADVARLEDDRRVDAFVLHPVVQMMERVLCVLDVDPDVHQLGVDVVATQIVAEGLVERSTVVVEQRLDGLELLPPPLDRTGRARVEVGALIGDQARVVRNRRVYGHGWISPAFSVTRLVTRGEVAGSRSTAPDITSN
jgi:hypothetical protein